MQVKKVFSLLLVLTVCMSSFSMTAMAVGVDPQVEAVAVRATGWFNMDVPGGTIYEIC